MKRTSNTSLAARNFQANPKRPISPVPMTGLAYRVTSGKVERNDSMDVKFEAAAPVIPSPINHSYNFLSE
jgi:hypothetical protein